MSNRIQALIALIIMIIIFQIGKHCVRQYNLPLATKFVYVKHSFIDELVSEHVCYYWVVLSTPLALIEPLSSINIIESEKTSWI